MPRVIGIDIPGRKQLQYSLRYIHGIGPAVAIQVMERLGLDPEMKAEGLSADDIGRLNTLLQSGEFELEGDRRRAVQGDITRLRAIRCYRGSRHDRGLPVRGQRTQKNSRTRKGRRKTVAGKKG